MTDDAPPLTDAPISAAARLAALRFLTIGCTLRLFTNDVTPAAASEVSDFREPSGGGYSPYRIPGGEWAVYGLEATAKHSWKLRGVKTDLYGWFLERGGVFVTGLRFPDAPVKVTVYGGDVEVTAAIRMT